MDWGFILQVTLAVLGAALFFGGSIVHRGSARTGVRSSAAAGIASGMVMLAIVFTTVGYSTNYESPDPVVETVGSASGNGPIDVSAVAPVTAAREDDHAIAD